MFNPKIIVDIGGNHKGEIKIAKTMIMVAAQLCNVDIIKFQKRTNKELLTEEEYNRPHPNIENSYGNTYGEHREFLEFDIETHKELKKICESNNVIYSCSVWDITAAKEIISLNPKMIKIPSALNLNFKLLQYVIDNYEGEIHLSLGMTDYDEEDKIVKFFIDNGREKDLILYACTSDYPVNYKDINILELVRLKKQYPLVKGIGFSGHHIGIIPDLIATTLGVMFIERHYTLDRSWKGTDHSASLDSYNLHSLIKNIENINAMYSEKNGKILDCEIKQRKKLKKVINYEE